MEQETIYGSSDDSHIVMSPKVQSLAGSMYEEFERMIGKYDEDVVKGLMPLVVNVLQCLDISYTENQEHEVELELLREDNEQLVTQYEREKQLRKTTEQKLLEVEDALEDERKELFEKIESLESIVRMLELKSKNSSDHVYRLEEREQEMKKEYTKLHERYTELFKTHMDCIERTKILAGSNDRVDLPGRPRLPGLSMTQLNRSSGPVSFGFSSLEPSNNLKSIGPGGIDCPPIPASPPDNSESNTSLKNELKEQEIENIDDEPSSAVEPSEKGWSETLGSVISKDDDSSPDQDLSEDIPFGMVSSTTATGKSHTKREQRSGNTLYQELSFQDADALVEMDEGADITGSWVHPGDFPSSVNDNFFGMGKEVENLIMENNELLATKNALNVVKDDLIVKVDELTSEQEMMRNEIKSLQAVRTNLRQRIEQLEDDLKRIKEENDKLNKANNKSDDEDDVPMAQRKKFTRAEMARVLMERNQYKERYIELQEAVRWSEMIRATKNDPSIDKKHKQSVWKFFSNLFTGTTDVRGGPPNSLRDMPYNMRYDAPSHHVSPALESIRKRNMTERRRGLDYISPTDISNEKGIARRAMEKKEQFRQVRAHVSKDDGRLRAYGWSLPSKAQTLNPPPCNTSHVPVPVPIYCRPLTECEPGMKVNTILWCATGVNLSGGITRDGGVVVGASVFYPTQEDAASNKSIESNESASNPEIEKIHQELKEGEKLIQENEDPNLQRLSSLVWICTSTKSINTVSTVSIVDANNPADIIGSFTICQAHLLCIASVPGAKESDYASLDEDEINHLNVEEVSLMNGELSSEPESASKEDTDIVIGKITFVSCATGSEKPISISEDDANNEDNSNDDHLDVASAAEPTEFRSVVAENLLQSEPNIVENVIPTRRLVKEYKEGLLKDGLSDLSADNNVANEEVKKMSSVLPTVWLGSQNGCIFVHSAVSQWSRCLHSINLKKPVLSILHLSVKVICALADGSIAIFRRGPDGQWDLSKFHCVRLGSNQFSVRCLAAVHLKVWCGYKNKIHVFDPKTMTVQTTIDAHPRKESQVRQMAWLGDGVWVSIRLDSTLRLYHAHNYQHLQDVDIEPYVSKMLGTGKLGFSFVRITALLISSHRLWIGTGNGVIISVPLSEQAGSNANNLTGRVPGGIVRVFSDPATSQVTPGSFIPYCSMAQAQLSFHGHRDAVKFFVAVPGNGGISAASTIRRENPVIETVTESEVLPSMLVMSGGEGYIDFRTGIHDDSVNSEDDMDNNSIYKKSDPPYLIVWQGEVTNNKNLYLFS